MAHAPCTFLKPMGSTIAVTPSERDFLFEERRRAMREVPDLGFHRSVKNKEIPFPFSAVLVVYARDRDGSLLARVTIGKPDAGYCYTRKLRVPASLGSTSGRSIRLRRGSRTG